MDRVLNNARNIFIPDDVQINILRECKKYKLETCYDDDDIMYIGKYFFIDLIDAKKIIIYLLGTLNNDIIVLNENIDLLYDDKDLEDFSIGSLLKYNQHNRNNYLCLNCYMCEGCTRCNRCLFTKDCSNSSLCYGCMDCKECSNCHTCTYCTTCKYCTGCNKCINCEECCDSEECNSCGMMNGMTMCLNCRRCVNCKTYCKNCIECTNCNNCTNCTCCNNCTDCTSCTGCIECTNCDNYDHMIYKSGSKNVNQSDEETNIFNRTGYVI